MQRIPHVLSQETRALMPTGKKPTIVAIPEGAIITIVEPRSEHDGLVAVEWQGRTVRMFAEDIALRASPILPEDCDDVLRALQDALSAAQNQREMASESFHQIIREVPSGVPNPDGSDRIRQMSHEYKDAQRAVAAASRRMSEFLVHGRTPPEREAKGSAITEFPASANNAG